MPLLLVDLDNTLIDRAGAFDRWARGFAAARRGDAGDAAWLVAADRDGLEPRERVAGMIAERFGLGAQDEGAILAELRGGLGGELVADDAVILARRRARAAGGAPFVVTNGTVAQQERKLRQTGLDREVAGWVVSEGAGLRKPDPRTYALVCSRLKVEPAQTVFLDDYAPNVDGARQAGLHAVLYRDNAQAISDIEELLGRNSTA